MPPHFPNPEEYQNQPLWYIVQALSWRSDTVEVILSKIEEYQKKDSKYTTFSPEVIVNELKEVLKMFEHRKKIVEAKET